MFRLPHGMPSNSSSIDELTDFLECECIKSVYRRVSVASIISPILIGSDEIDIEGADDDSDRFRIKMDEVLTEIDRRKQASNYNYPFEIIGNGIELCNYDNPIYWVYSYLLFCTRFNMNVDKKMGGIDGTLLFEKFSKFIAKEYFGERSDAMVFGTAAKINFEEKVNELCKAVGEGSEFDNKNNLSPSHMKDAKLDVVVWKSFADKNVSKMIGFGQCKTGTTWKNDNSLSQLQPQTFCKNWLRRSPVHDPIRMFFISDTFLLDNWYSKSTEAGIIFDRFRLMDYLPNSEQFHCEVYNDLLVWTKEAFSKL